jgi:glycosyltransferase involved in cell wall biosynthesis
MKYPVCLFTVVYPGCEDHLGRFMQSVEEQDTDQFELLVLNDGLPDFERFTNITKKLIHEYPVSGSIAKIREQGIDLLLESSYEKIVFADADDYFSSNRMRTAASALEKTDIYVNDLTTVDENGTILTPNYFSKRLNNEFVITNDYILQKNIMGLGNSAVRKSVLDKTDIPDSTIAVDWLIFTDQLLKGASAHFNNDCVTFYLQHDQNSAGLKNLTPERLIRALEVQIQNANYFAEVSAGHMKWLSNLEKLKTHLSKSDESINHWLNRLEKQLPDYPFWWEEIKILDQIITKL